MSKKLLIGLGSVLAMVGLGVLGNLAHPTDGKADPLSSAGQDTQVITSSERADGLKNEDINLEFADQVGIKVLDLARSQIRPMMAEKGVSEEQFPISQKTTVVDQGEMRYLVTKIYFNNIPSVVQFSTIKNGVMHRVSCISPDVLLVVVIPGKCGDAAKSQLGIIFP